MKASELRVLGDDQLRAQINEHLKELFNLRFQKVTGRLTNAARPRAVRRDIARIKTVLRERELAREFDQG